MSAKKLSKLLRVLFIFSLLVAPYSGFADSPCALSAAALKDASSIRGLRSKSSVPCLLHDKQQVKDHLTRIIDTKITPERVRYEELYFKALGLIPKDYDYREGVLNLYLNQLGGYYDPEKNHYVMAKWLPDSMQYSIAVHELTHALQDQHYDLDKFMDIQKLSSDTLLAHSALVEGDASAVMANHARRLRKQPGIEKDLDVEALVMQTVLGASMIAERSEAPKSLLSLMLFPYTSGLRFAHAILKSGGYSAIDKAFRAPPSSTRDILHPELYQRKKTSKELSFKIADVAGKLSSKVVHSDVVGEFTIRVMFEAVGHTETDAIRLSDGWLADRLVLIALEKNKVDLKWRTKWDKKNDAEEFYSGLSLVRKISPEMELTQRDDEVLVSMILTKPRQLS